MWEFHRPNNLDLQQINGKEKKKEVGKESCY